MPVYFAARHLARPDGYIGAERAKIMAECGALVKLAPSMPTIGTVWVKPGVSSNEKRPIRRGARSLIYSAGAGRAVACERGLAANFRTTT